MYLWRGREGEVLYVGKAKRLRSRVRSYFATDFPDSPRNRLLQRLIADVETIVVPSEPGSLILENNLIKEYRPRFNVRLKDDKSYPSIAVTLDEPFPRVLVTRKRDIPGARYFGPYTDVGQLRRTLAIIRRLYTVRSCEDKLPEERRERPCLDFYIGRCRAPCMGWQDLPDYRRMVEDVVEFLEGRTQDVRAEGARSDAPGERAGRLRASQGNEGRAPLAGAIGRAARRRGDGHRRRRCGRLRPRRRRRSRGAHPGTRGRVVVREHRFLEGLRKKGTAPS